MDYIITALISYLFGSIPFGYIFTKIFLKKDIRDVGSGNIGATNVLRTGNKKYHKYWQVTFHNLMIILLVNNLAILNM